MSLFSANFMLREEEASERVGLSLLEGRFVIPLLPGGAVPLEGPGGAGRRLRFPWKRFRRTEGGAMLILAEV